MSYLNGKQVLFSAPVQVRYSEGYRDGQMALLENSEHLKGTKSGFTVEVDDCSPVEHDLKITLSSSPGIENLLPAGYEQLGAGMSTIYDGLTITSEGDDWLRVEGFCTGENYYMGMCFAKFMRTDIGGTLDFYIEPNKEYFVGFEAITSDPDFEGKVEVFFVPEGQPYGSGYSQIFTENTSFILDDCGCYEKYIFNVFGLRFKPQEHIDCKIRPYLSATPPEAGPDEFIGVTITKTGTDGEPETVQANEDGTVEGLKSSYPGFTLASNTAGVVIQCDYYKDIDKCIEAKVAEAERQYTEAINAINTDLATLTDIEKEQGAEE